MSPEAIYLQNLPLIERIARSAARKRFLNADDTEEFTQFVRFRLLLDNYAVIRAFKGASKFSTYLVKVITNLCHEWCNKQRGGKWRSSVEAKRLGADAMELERLIVRDHLTFDEAASIMITRAGSQLTRKALYRLYCRLPERTLPWVPGPDVAPNESDDRIKEQEREQNSRWVFRVLDELIATLLPEDQLILKFRFLHSRTVPEIARLLPHINPPKQLYKRLDNLFKILRQGLEKAGISKADIADLVPEMESDVEPEPGNPPPGPSHDPEGEE